MSSAQFKKMDRVPGIVSDHEVGEQSVENTNGALVKPDVTLFHRLPKISPKSALQYELASGRQADSSSVAVGQSSYEDGLRDGEKKASLVYLDTIKLLETSLATLNDQYQLIRTNIEIGHFNAVAQCLKAVLPQLSERSAVNQIRALIKDLCTSSLDGKVCVQINPAQAEEIDKIIGAQNDTASIIEVLPNQQIQIGNVKCHWKSGGASIDTTSVLQQCLDAIDAAYVEKNEKEGELHV